MEKERIIKLKLGIPVTYNTSVFNDDGLNLDELFARRDTKYQLITEELEEKIKNIKFPSNVLASDSIFLKTKKYDQYNYLEIIKMKDNNLEIRFGYNGLSLFNGDDEGSTCVKLSATEIKLSRMSPMFAGELEINTLKLDLDGVTINDKELICSSNQIEIDNWDRYDYIPDNTILTLSLEMPYYHEIDVEIKSGSTLEDLDITGHVQKEIIKEAIIGHNVYKIDETAFTSCENLLSVVINDATRLIGPRAFIGCKNLQSVSIYGVKLFDSFAFAGCKINTIYINNIEDWCKSTFSAPTSNPAYSKKDTLDVYIGDHNSLALDIVIPNTISTIDAYSFYNFLITSLSAPTVNKINSLAFYGCDQLSQVDLPKLIETGNQSFRNCDELQSIDFPSATTIGDFSFRECNKLKSVNLPSVTYIGKAAFYSCDSLTQLYIPNIEAIGSLAFSGCSRIKEVTYGKTIEEWNALANKPTIAAGGIVHCFDGDINY